MDWRRVLLWAGLAAILVGAILLIARVSIIAFRHVQKAERPLERALATAAGAAPAPAGAAAHHQQCGTPGPRC
jgi:hypothetical protein